METYKNLYPQVWSWDNLYRAYRRARKGKRGRGPVAAFEWDLEGNRVGQGTHRALDRCQAFARRYAYVLPCDLRQFFPSIDHAILRAILGRTLAGHGGHSRARLCPLPHSPPSQAAQRDPVSAAAPTAPRCLRAGGDHL